MFQYRVPTEQEKVLLAEIDTLFCMNCKNEEESHILWSWLYSVYVESNISEQDLSRFKEAISQSPDYIKVLGNTLAQILESVKKGETEKLQIVNDEVSKFQSLS